MLRIALLAAWGCGFAWAQVADPGLNFEVASVKPAAPPTDGRTGPNMQGGPESADPGQIHYSNVTLMDLFVTGYHVRTAQVTGPAWIETERYDVVAKLPAGATKEQLRVMLQHLITERFQVTLHRVSKEFSVYEMVVGKGGVKFKETTLDLKAPVPAGPVVAPGGPKLDGNGFPILDRAAMIIMRIRNERGAVENRIVGRARELSVLAETVENEVKMPVIDRTGLTGKYDFTLEFTPEGAVVAQPGAEGLKPPGVPDVQQGPPMAAALQEQLGLRLEQKKAALDILVIDHAEKTPTEN